MEAAPGEEEALEAAAPPEGPPRFKDDAERAVHEAALAEAAMADQQTLARCDSPAGPAEPAGRLAEVRARRDKARQEREAEAAREAELEAAQRRAAMEEAAAMEASGERPELEMPGPKEQKAALQRLQECAGDDFLKRHSLKGAGGNKLAKIKGAAFKKIFEDFCETAEIEELRRYKASE